jgi:hypothetical protein
MASGLRSVIGKVDFAKQVPVDSTMIAVTCVPPRSTPIALADDFDWLLIMWWLFLELPGHILR